MSTGMTSLLERVAKGLGVGGSVEGLEGIVRLAEHFGMDSDTLRRDLEAVAIERTVMWLVGPIDRSLNYDERLAVVRYRLEALRLEGIDSPLEDAVKAIVDAQAVVAVAASSKKVGIHSISEPVADGILASQGYRCAVCGVPLRSRARKGCLRFEAGREPVAREHLDHVMPFYWGGNEGNVRALCEHCNTVKNDRMGVQEDGLVLVANHLRSKARAERWRRAAFWTLQAARGCRSSACSNSAKAGTMFVGKIEPSSPWVYGNLAVWCDTHAPVSTTWLHDQSTLARIARR